MAETPSILLPSILPIQNPGSYKLHLASWNGQVQPLDVFVRDREEWDGWSAWRSTRNDFSRECIFSLIDFYPQRDVWLFGGAYRVLNRMPVDNAPSYTIEPLREHEPFVGRLKVRFARPSRGKAHNFEKHYASIEVVELLAAPYGGEAFPGHDRINEPFASLESIVRSQKPDWKAALENTKGVYLIVDSETGRQYVGSAYGDAGIWSRWSTYTINGHGDNAELTAIIEANGLDYARANFCFSILELCPAKATDVAIIDREQHWKAVLGSRAHGLNRN